VRSTRKNFVWTPAAMGAKGGRKSKRELTTEQARAMVKRREEIRRKNRRAEK
jgi:hypothetical protein